MYEIMVMMENLGTAPNLVDACFIAMHSLKQRQKDGNMDCAMALYEGTWVVNKEEKSPIPHMLKSIREVVFDNHLFDENGDIVWGNVDSSIDRDNLPVYASDVGNNEVKAKPRSDTLERLGPKTDKFLYRDHRGSLVDSMETVQEFENFYQLRNYLLEKHPIPGLVDVAEDFEHDSRVNWDNHTVTFNGAICGYTNAYVKADV